MSVPPAAGPRLDVDGAQFAAANVFGYTARPEVTSATMGTHNDSYACDAFVNTVSDAVSPGRHLPPRFSTKCQDEASGHYYCGFRFDSPQLVRKRLLASDFFSVTRCRDTTPMPPHKLYEKLVELGDMK